MSRPPLTFGFLQPRDVGSLCRLLNGSFEGEYREQGLDVSQFRRQYQLVALANRLLVPLRLPPEDCMLAAIWDSTGAATLLNTCGTRSRRMALVIWEAVVP